MKKQPKTKTGNIGIGITNSDAQITVTCTECNQKDTFGNNKFLINIVGLLEFRCDECGYIMRTRGLLSTKKKECACCGKYHGVVCKMCKKVGCYNACPERVGLGTPYPCVKLDLRDDGTGNKVIVKMKNKQKTYTETDEAYWIIIKEGVEEYRKEVIPGVSLEFNKEDELIGIEIMKPKDKQKTDRELDRTKIHWVCKDCGLKYGKGYKGGMSTWHKGKCDICKVARVVTESRDFGYLKGDDIVRYEI